MERHDTDVVSLIGGVLFMGLGLAFVLDALNGWSSNIAWVPPIVLIVLGVVGVVSTMSRQRAIPADAPRDPD
jgi:hypothetical protein